ncbi:unnamed protein product, partial [Durusdinium trenchii]
AGVDVDGANLFGQSACFLAEWYGHSPAVDLLKSYGALSVTRPERPELPRWQPSLSDRQVEELPGNSWLLERSFEEAFLREFDSLAARLPVPDMEVDRRTAQRLFVCSEEISEALGALLRPSLGFSLAALPTLQECRCSFGTACGLPMASWIRLCEDSGLLTRPSNYTQLAPLFDGLLRRRRNAAAAPRTQRRATRRHGVRECEAWAGITVPARASS